MFITKKQHTASLDKIHYTFKFLIRNLKKDNSTLSNRIDRLERDLKAIKRYLNVGFVNIPSEYVVKEIDK